MIGLEIEWLKKCLHYPISAPSKTLPISLPKHYRSIALMASLPSLLPTSPLVPPHLLNHFPSFSITITLLYRYLSSILPVCHPVLSQPYCPITFSQHLRFRHVSLRPRPDDGILRRDHHNMNMSQISHLSSGAGGLMHCIIS